ncbi:heavy metal translocating P-type ATPase [Francisella frigiditurris]|uniref:P-type Zn(2+) transporter n=1 Tax=Francisella frigiditurris TaxID=1542390 RepID=A0A1J0KWJ1_9GAMM|nr:heavy metal translocating P-type ATPase [Francisella frigiditurris]APC97996.1 copper-translocating P-type ATPase [Francisella frigiditurris]
MSGTKNYLSFKVYGLDCVEEVNIIKKALAKNVPEDQLQFDLLNSKLLIEQSPNNQISAKEIVALIKKSGLKATTWDEHIKNNDENQSFWKRHLRLITTLFSGLFIVAAYLYHGFLHGFVHALVVGESSATEAFPIVSQVFYLLAIISGSWFVFPKAWAALKRFDADMNLLMVIAIVCAVAIGQWFEASIVSFLFAFSLSLESWSVGNARSAITKLITLTPDKALVYCCHDKEFEEKPISEINIGRRVLIKPGERVALDGEVIKGSSFLNQAPITGESMPIQKQVGDTVFAGSINGNGTIEIKTTKTAEDSSVAKIIQAIEHAQSKRSESEKWVDRFARVYTPAMLILAILIAIVPSLFLGGAWLSWIYEALVILVIACPCALVISTPISIVSSLASAARNGVLIKGGTFIEIPAKLKAIAFDKTGTLTQGKPSVREVITNNISEEELIKIAGSLEKNTDHPIAEAILNYSKEHNIGLVDSDDTKVISGKGVSGKVEGKEYWLGSHVFSHEKQLCENSSMHEKAVKLENLGHTLIFVGNDKEIIGIIAVQDALKENIQIILNNLRELGIEQTVMLTGDNSGTAKALGKQSGIDKVYAELLPENKVSKVEELVEQYKEVAMVGDGINDAPALARSNLGIAMGAIGSDVAIETADVALMSDDLSKLPWLIKHSKRTVNIIKQNIIFAITIKALFITLAIAGVATLWMAIVADMGATLVVIMNALRLLKIK